VGPGRLTRSWHGLQDKDLEGLRVRGGVHGIAKALQTDPHHGLPAAADAAAAESVEEHSRVFGPNKFKEVPPKNFFVLCFENLQDPIILLLIAAALVRLAGRSLLPAGSKHTT
jgi:Ca2+-transporting ATPase